MIDNEMETFTAAEARSAGLIESIKRGETIVEGYYTLTAKGLMFNQRAFVFKDKLGNLRVGRFKDDRELLEIGNENTDESEHINDA